MRATTVRVRPETRAVLEELAESSGASVSELVERAVDDLRRRQFLEGLAEDFERLRADPERWQAEIEERAEWECTLADGITGVLDKEYEAV